MPFLLTSGLACILVRSAGIYAVGNRWDQLVNRTALREQVAFEAVRLLPKSLFSDAVGWGARRRLPKAMRRLAYTGFARAVGANLDEVELPLDEYRTFGDFFARALRPGVRDVVADPDTLACPTDGAMGAVGESHQGTLLQAKGHDYRLDDLLVDEQAAARVRGGAYATIYLSPRDYHRVHAPADADWLGYDFVPGTQYPVNPTWVARQPNLFARNERLVFHLRAPCGAVELVMVGATGVGNMRLVDGVETRTFRDQPGPVRVRFETPRQVLRGDELGSFQLGSTVILLFEPGQVRLAVETGQDVRCGGVLGQGRAVKKSGRAA